MHPEQEAFEKNIDANPLDATNHLVYADWLDDHGQHDEAAFRRSIGKWHQHDPLNYKKWNMPYRPGKGILFSSTTHPLPEGISPGFMNTSSSTTSFKNYRHLEDTFRDAFIAHRKQYTPNPDYKDTDSSETHNAEQFSRRRKSMKSI